MTGKIRKNRPKFISDRTLKRGFPLVSDSTIAVYLREIKDLKPLKRGQEGRLGRKIIKGDHKALNELVKHNLKYVVSVANQYRGCGISLCDLINEGNIGLIHSAGKFDPGRKVKFITYATWWVRQSIMQAIAKNSGTVRLPIKQVGMLSKIEERYRQLTQKMGREPTLVEMGKALDINPEDIESILRVYRSHLSLNTPLKNSIENSYLDFLVESNSSSAEELMIREDLTSEMLELLKELPERDALILKLRFGFKDPPRTLEEIGKRINLSRERVRQIEKRAKEKLRAKAKTKSLQDYLLSS